MTTLLHRLGEALTLVSPFKLVAVSRQVLHEIGGPPPGDPPALRGLADAFRTAAAATEPLAAEVRTAVRPPAAERVDAGARVIASSAEQVVDATASAVSRTPPAFQAAARALDTLADLITEQRRTHAELHQRLSGAARDASHLGGVPAPDPTALDDLVHIIRGCIAVYTDATEAAGRAAAVFADVAGGARAGAAVSGGLHPADAVVLAAQGVTAGGYDDGVLTVGQLRRAGERLGALPAPDAATVRALVDGARSGTERAYLLKAVAAGHDLAGLAAFAAAIRGRDEPWLHNHLSLIDRAGPGAQDRFGADVDQFDPYTCGTTCVIVARAEADPCYALTLTGGLEPPYDQADREEFDRRLTAEQRLVHDATNTLWPQALGTFPASLARWLNQHICGPRYYWHLVDDTDRRGISDALCEVVTAVDGGHPVPILVGGPVPRHYVLVVGHSCDDLLIFEPTSGDTVRVPAVDFVAGTLAEHTGFEHVQAIIAPRP
ncbi:MAG TPA: hypothetical protein VGJ95_05530 [Pseudonocardiaceae bacterium]